MAAPISIILPTYNRALLLPRAIGSVQRQTHEDWELIVVDDGGTDETVSVVEAYSCADNRIRLVRQANAGPAEARNTGFLHAGGALITYIDSDDEYAPEHLALRLRYLADHPDIDCIHGGCVVIGDPDRRFVPDRHDRHRLIPIEDCVIGATIVVRSDVLRAVGGWRTGFAEDADLLARIAASYRVIRIGYPTYRYHRDTPDSRCDEHRLAHE